MLIYNFQKEFIGIDEADLEIFGYKNLSELKAESSDFADMFVRTPGYIHNFKHVHWIDFITCADPSEQAKVIIEVNSKTYKALLTIETVYLSDSPTSKAYLVHLNNLRTLTLQENGEFSEDIARKKPPKIEPTIGHAFNLSPEAEEELEATPVLEGFKPFEDIQGTEETPEILDFPKKVQEDIEPVEETLEVLEKAPLDISFDDEIDEPAEIQMPTIDIVDDLSLDIDIHEDENTTEKTVLEIEDENDDDDYDYSYEYNPQLASDELGLPIDLIEEFIQDFISQAKEFKDELYKSLDEGDTDNVKILSHKLKGVAANLRIEDAFNTLSIINTSSDISEVEKYLNIFYKTIAKLSGEELQSANPVAKESAEKEAIEIKPVDIEQETQDDDLYDDDFILNFKESTDTDSKESEEKKDDDDDDDLYLNFDASMQDSEVPKKIEIPELADDNFLNETEDALEDGLLDIDDLLTIDENIPEAIKEIQETIEPVEDDISIDIEDDFIATTEVEKIQEIEKLPEINYSKELIANEIGLDQEIFNEIFNDYVVDSKSTADTILEAIIEEDFTKCKQETIKLKGMSDNMRINSFKEELTTLINSTDKDELTKAIKKIDAVIAQISTDKGLNK